MKKSYLFILLFVLLVAFVGFRYIKQRGNEQPPPPSVPVAGALGCTRTTGAIDSNILGLNAPPGGLVAKDLPYLQDLGVKWMRGVVGWRYVETNEGAYSWQESDTVVRVAGENNIKLLSGLGGDIPNWVWAKDRQGRIDAMYIFAKTVTTRYRGKIHYYEIANEPNLPGYGFYEANKSLADPTFVSTYLDFLVAANRGVHEVDPNAVIVIGGLSPDGMSPLTFMKQLYGLGGKDCFDVFAYHPYDSAGRFKEKADAIRAELTRYGDSTKPIWFNEFGSNDESQQVTVMNQMKDELSAVPAWFWFDLRDWGTTKDEQFGLLTLDYQKRPSYDLFKQILQSQK